MLRASQAWSSTLFPDVVVFAGGQVPVLEGERFAGAVGRLLAREHLTGGARLRITGANRDTGAMLVQVNLRVGDTPARMQTLTHGRGDALPAVLRLERQIKALRAPWQPRPWPDPTAAEPDTSGPGKLSRRKPVLLATSRPLVAAAVMDAMDYGVHLFTDADTGEEAVVYRAGPAGLRLARQHSVQPPRSASDGLGPFTINPRPAPVLTETRATDRACEHGLPFLFYTDVVSGRGHLLYRRYDADLTLVTPAVGGIATTTG
ncbi:sigma 54 modulation/S30EA ribosomal C-terminal domain-containing protein [Nocardia sp. R6R-6]|uniref:sigma 54 modulation/S30EA ribosomal C-terminal domain-containing protein n=1 Tax=Nocardia sp. R6R-6 TaxID=3459303 RepID=UPI00403DC146